jgi:hypothetical protein
MRDEEYKYSGEFPIRQDITILPSDDPKRLKLGWIFLEGEVVLKSQKGFYLGFLFDEIDMNGTKLKMPKGRLRNIDEIKEGDLVYSTWYDGEVVAMRVEGINLESKSALGKINDSCYGNLYFENDARKCWTCDGYMFINRDALARLNVTAGNSGGEY